MKNPIDPNRTMAFDFRMYLDTINGLGQEAYGDHFLVRKRDYASVYKLLAYFEEIEEETTWLNLDLRKGLLLTDMDTAEKGMVLLLTAMAIDKYPLFEFHSCQLLPLQYMKDGKAAIDKYCELISGVYDKRDNIEFFMGLGTETDLMHRGKRCNVMDEVIQRRYTLFEEHGLRTHITTHLSIHQLEMRYGKEVMSCMMNMFNFVKF
jgi:hypothetical protein